ncbi:isochorismate synthase [Motilibacter rhizosphaerae]|uniref:isochorismate synthase n=1 Tax=Motilibacter rhizosphaerae TaxID=598652 RepID=A0A4Q7NAX5_9ACTN|nr:isochorismate synthase [Motilibacter rhizosphaerae]RZS79031.1 isochorismate synthase [Motilibacter rhizosphaerae]
MTTAPLPEPLVARTEAVADPGALLATLPEHGPLAWVREEDGLVGWGEAARLVVRGAGRFLEAEQWWQGVTADAVVDDAVGLPGTGLVAFASLAFSDEGDSVLVVPEVVLGRRGGRAWVTRVGAPGPSVRTPVREPVGVRWPDEDPLGRWRGAVQWATNAISRGELDKVVLAVEVLATAAEDLDPRWLLQRLAADYPSTWTYAVEGLVGATPELLVRRLGEEVESRVLAGTARRGGADLLRSEKDRAEHAYAVDSLVAGFSAHCKEISTSEPFVLELPNVVHLATDVRARVADGASLLSLAGALHPTAAVGGTPTRTALRAIRRLEPHDRGRYAGPVGWVDAAGNGELGLALRCAQLDGPTARLWAGCGIVVDSDPEAEVAEAQAKLEPVRRALGS